MKKQSFINFAGIDYWYHNRAHAELQIMTRLAKDHRVLFVNSIGMRAPTVKNSPAPFKRILRKVKSITKFVRRPEADLKNFYVFSPLIIPIYESKLIQKLNALLVAFQIRAICLFIGIKNPVISVTVPSASKIVQHIPHTKLVLHRFDKMSEFKGANRELIQEHERELLGAADYVLFSSTALMKDEQHLVQGQSQFFDHGVDLQLFTDQYSMPAAMKEIQRPIIGFFGGLDEHIIDFELLEKIASDITYASLVLIGAAPRPIDDLLQYENVIWLGKKEKEEIPKYGSSFDVSIMPFKKSQWLEYANPIKLKEYLALGLPIVSTPMNEVRKYDQHVVIAEDSELFVSSIKEIIDNIDEYKTSEFRSAQRARIKNKDWDDRALAYLSLLSD